ncbi:MAG: LD-carboxypeptidase [Deltaproteobacteria bacterium]|nr:LD-carboxypeptidase [Deltaproteobacteria bacterium]
MPRSPHTRSVAAGSTLALVAPSGVFSRAAFEAGAARLGQRYRVKFDEGIFARDGFFAGSDPRRVAELRAALADDEVDAILCARGGHGATRLLPSISADEVRAAGKRIVGFSDITALHALWARAGVASLHGPMVASLAKLDDTHFARFVAALEGRPPEPTSDLVRLASGQARGPLLGGNLAVLTALLGSAFMPPLTGAVLFLEDIGERPYRVDRMLTSLRHAGVFERVHGVVLGAFTEAAPGKDGVRIEDVLQDRLGDLGVPVATGLSAGHIDDNLELPLGQEVALDADAGTLRWV